ncbi:MAG TPA: dihydroxy-acid dehydratase, partial [Nocardioides sp.]|nr:dihydroxy-acid dehydratase [Nocardioides sp.]
LARVLDGDLVTVDADAGVLEVALADDELEHRATTGRAPHDVEWAGTGRELFSGFRAIVGTAETGASVIRPLPAPTEEAPVVQPV